MKPQDESTSVGSGRQAPGAETSQAPYDRPQVRISPTCEKDLSRKQEEFVRALFGFLETQPAAKLFRFILCPKKRRADFSCCWEIDPETGQVFCSPCPEFGVVESDGGAVSA